VLLCLLATPAWFLASMLCFLLIPTAFHWSVAKTSLLWLAIASALFATFCVLAARAWYNGRWGMAALLTGIALAAGMLLGMQAENIAQRRLVWPWKAADSSSNSFGTPHWPIPPRATGR
jgi:hypothetical protein